VFAINGSSKHFIKFNLKPDFSLVKENLIIHKTLKQKLDKEMYIYLYSYFINGEFGKAVIMQALLVWIIII